MRIDEFGIGRVNHGPWLVSINRAHILELNYE